MKKCKYFFVLIFLIPLASFAQTDLVESHRTHPQLNPINPKLVSYEYQGNIEFVEEFDLAGSVGTVKCQTEEDRSIESLSSTIFADHDDISEEEQELSGDFNCAYLDWRPVLDTEGKYWFSFTSGIEKKLYAGYLRYEYYGNVSPPYVAETKIFEIYQTDSRVLMRPKWSPDGQSLIFNNGDQVMMIDKVLAQINEKGLREFEANTYSDDLQERRESSSYQLKSLDAYPILENAHSPEWSPNGRYIIFENSPPAGQRGSGELLLMDVNKLNNSEGTDAIVNIDDMMMRTGAISSEKYKPKWSNTGEHLTYLIPSFRENQWDVKVLNVFYSDDGEIEQFGSTSGRNRRAFVENVFRGASMRSGFPITTLSGEGGTTQALFVISNDQQNNNPVIVYPINDEAISSGIENNAFVISNTNQNDHLDVVNDGSLTHISYVSQVEGALNVQNAYLTIDEVLSKDEVGDDQMNISFLPRELGRNKAMFRSALFPGLGQLYKGDTKKALLFGGGTLLAGVGLFFLMTQNSSLKNDFQSADDEFRNDKIEAGSVSKIIDEYEAKYKLYENLKDKENSINTNNYLITAVSGILVGTYIYSLFDSRQGFPIIKTRDNNRIKVSLKPQMTSISNNESFAGALQFQLNFN